MTSRFVSGGVIAGHEDDTNTNSTDEGASRKTETSTSTLVGDRRSRNGAGNTASSVEWETVQRDLEEDRRRRAEARKRDVEGGGEKSLYDILQANKAAKQAAFEEQNRIRNQFRALDDDEIDFLHGVDDGKRAEEERVRRETEEGLASFRRAQMQAVGSGDADAGGADSGAVGAGTGNEPEGWGTNPARKRKREKEREKGGFKGLKRRSSLVEEERGGSRDEERKGEDERGTEMHTKGIPVSTSTSTGAGSGPGSVSVLAKEVSMASSGQAAGASKPAPASKPKASLGLVDYGSDEDDD
ncbi:N-terminal domain of NEFA-interacting nuclear protein NIP30-domain-containing protein [Xylaria venustula]|nr:N-terminal domain of NEFA-interacting nuclear protein NIP30-domain-containing protein [Xylaria venustula]